MIANADKLKKEFVGIGDQTYAVGLFRFVAGENRNLPVVHTGNIALLPSDERLPVTDWERPSGDHRRFVEGFLVESQSIQGLSGSPVFVRPTIILPGIQMKGGKEHMARLPRLDLLLLGVWQSAWDARADEALAVDRGREIRVPVGLGVVVPAAKLIDILERQELKDQRAERKRVRERDATASLDSTLAERAETDETKNS